MAKLTLRNEKEVEKNLLFPLFRDTLGYPEESLEWGKRVPITFGRETRIKEADLVASHGQRPVVTVEAKSPTETVQSGISQVDSYAFRLETPFSVVTNGKHFVLRGYYAGNSRINVIDSSVSDLSRGRWSRVASLISFKNILSSIQPANTVATPDEGKIKDFRRFFRKLHNVIRDRDKLDPGAAFDELSKLLFLKAAEDELQASGANRPSLTPDIVAEFERTGRGPEMVNQWFRSAVCELFPSVFDEHIRINLTTGTLRDVLLMMQPFHIRNGDVDIKGRAFEEFLPSQLRGKGLGQFFTPRPIVNFMAEMAGISLHDTVVDFSCGSGGFLIKAFELMKRRAEQLPVGILKRLGTTKDKLLEDIKSHQIYGIDAEPRAARTAKMNMLMWGDGKRVVRGNGLATTDFSGQPYEPAEYDPEVIGSGCSLILANPPFGSNEKDTAILDRYVLGAKLRAKTTEKTEILFLEKGLKLLHPEGRMLIVIPQGLLSGSRYRPVRDFLNSQAEIRAIVSLPTHTFVQSGVPTVNTCVLYVQKFAQAKADLFELKSEGLGAIEIREILRSDPDFDYPIFMGTTEFIGYEPGGRLIVRHDEETDLSLLVKDFENESVLSHPDVEVFEFANRHYGEKGYRRKDQVIRGTQRGLKTSFTVKLSETDDRLDPPYYLFRYQAGDLVEALTPLGDSITKARGLFTPTTDDELDAEYAVLSVSNDGRVSLNESRTGEELMNPTEKGKGKKKAAAKPKSAAKKRFQVVRHNDIVYNPMRVNIGSIGVVAEEFDGGLVSPDYVVFRSEGYDPEFLVNLLRSPFYKMYIDVVTTGSIRDRLYLSDLKKIRVPGIPEGKQDAICEWARQVDGSATQMLRAIKAERDAVNQHLHEFVKTPDAVPGTSTGIRRFADLAAQWKRESRLISNVTKKSLHPAYQQIIGMGDAAVPLILRDMETNGPDDWFWALTSITGANPITDAISGNIPAMTEAWLQWARQAGYLTDSLQKTKRRSRTSSTT